jgi:hypothetical protein
MASNLKEEKMKFDKSALLAAFAPKTVTHHVEGFGTVYIKELEASQTDALRAKLKADQDASQFGYELLILSVRDAEDKQVFSADDLAALKKSGNAIIEKLGSITLEINGFKKAPGEKN